MRGGELNTYERIDVDISAKTEVVYRIFDFSTASWGRVEVTGLSTGQRQSVTLRVEIYTGNGRQAPTWRSTQIKDEASDTSMILMLPVVWIRPWEELHLYLESSVSDTVDVTTIVVDAGNPTDAVATDGASRTASRADVSALATEANATSNKQAVLDRGNAAWKTADGFAEAGDAMALTASYDAAKTAASQSSVDSLPTATQVAAAVWAATTRTLTGFGSLVAAIKGALFDAGSTTNKLAVDGDGKVSANNLPVAPDNDGIAAAKAAAESADAKLPGDAVTKIGLIEAMRGTDGAYKGTPPTVDEIESKVAAVHGEGSYEAGDDSAVQDGLATLLERTAGGVTSKSPVATSGDATIVRGDSYTGGRALSWSSDGWPGLTGASVALFAESNQTGRVDLDGIAGVPSSVGQDTQTVAVDLSSEQTRELNLGASSYAFDLQATLADGAIVTLLRGSITVTEDVALAA